MTSADAPLTSSDDPKARAVLGLRRLAARLIDELIIGLFASAGIAAVWGVALVFGLMVGTTAIHSGNLDTMVDAGITAIWLYLFALVGSCAAGLLARLGYYRWAVRRPGDAAGLTVGHHALDLRILRRDGAPMRGRTFAWRDLMACLLMVLCLIVAGFAQSLTSWSKAGDIALVLTMIFIYFRPALSSLPHDRMADTHMLDLAAAATSKRADPEPAPSFVKPNGLPSS